VSVQTQAWGDIVRSLSPKEFLRRHPGYFLLSTSDPSELSTMFQTQILPEDNKEKKAKAGRRSFEVRWIHKESNDQHDPSLISVGRASSCDLSFRHPSVSKLHAHFKLGDKGKLWVIDLKSRNGTSVNGQQLAPDQQTDLVNRDRILFGSVSCMVLDAAALHECLSLGL
jgi:hypothetical protein